MTSVKEQLSKSKKPLGDPGNEKIKRFGSGFDNDGFR